MAEHSQGKMQMQRRRSTRRRLLSLELVALLFAVSLAARTPTTSLSESEAILSHRCIVLAEATILSGVDPQIPGLVRGRTRVVEVLRGEARTGTVDIAIASRVLAADSGTPSVVARVEPNQSPDETVLRPLFWCRHTPAGGVELLSNYRLIGQPESVLQVEQNRFTDLAVPLIWLGRWDDGVLQVREEQAVVMPDLQAYVRALLAEEPLSAILRLVADPRVPPLSRERAVRYLAGDIPPWPWHGNDEDVLRGYRPTVPPARLGECLDALRPAVMNLDGQVSRQALSAYCGLADQPRRDRLLAEWLHQPHRQISYPDLCLARHFGTADGAWRQGLRPSLLPGYDPLFAAMLLPDITGARDELDRALLCGMLGDGQLALALNGDTDTDSLTAYTAERARQLLHPASGIWLPYDVQRGWEIASGDAGPAFLRAHPVLAARECPFAVTWGLRRAPGVAPELVLVMENQANVAVTVSVPGITLRQTLSPEGGEGRSCSMVAWAPRSMPRTVQPMARTEIHLSLGDDEGILDLPAGEHGLEVVRFELTFDRPPQAEGTIWFGVMRHQVTTRF